jgi:hypothetical protein
VGVSEVLRKIWTEKVFGRDRRARPKREALYRALRVPHHTCMYEK